MAKAIKIAGLAFIAFLLLSMVSARANDDSIVFRNDLLEVKSYITEQQYSVGDVDLSGEVNKHDIYFLRDYIFKKGEAPRNLALADVNADGDVNVGDLVKLARDLYGNVQVGDVNLNGNIDIDDIRFMVDYIFKAGEEPELFEIADANLDGNLNVGDLTKLVSTIYGSFKQGDVDADGDVDKDDLDFLVDFVFRNGQEPIKLARADVNQDLEVNVGDITALATILGLNVQDSTSPTITLYDPEDDDEISTKKDSVNVEFEYKVEDESEIAYCELIIDGKSRDKDSSVERNVRNTLERELDDGSYDWQIKCADVYGNEAYSEKRDLRIDERDSENERRYEPITYTPEDDGSIQEGTEIGTINLGSDFEENVSKSSSLYIYWVIALLVLIILTMIVLISTLSRRL